jgi:hypothetical protein
MGVDKKYEKLRRKTTKSQEKMEKKRVRETSEFDDTAVLVSSSSSCSHSNSSTEDEVDLTQPSTSRPRGTPQRKKRKIMDENLLSLLDVAKVSDRAASLIMIPTIANVGKDPEEYNVSYSSIRRARQKSREKFSENLKKQFQTDKPLIIHWDGKLLEDITGNEVVDRLPVLISGSGEDQLLGVPKIDRGTGRHTANAVYQQIIDWNLNNQVKGMCFDTTASNTGRKNGACILLEQKLEKDLLWYPCRHHVLEIMLEAVVSPALQASSGPDIPLFKKFKANWNNIDQTSYDILDNFSTVDKHEMIKFATRKLNEIQPRDDYRELLELTIVLLGGTGTTEIKFKKPGAYHRARWMAKVIYSVKIFMFKKQFKLSKKEESNLRDICCFAVSIYIKHWFSATCAASAPRNDLNLLKSLQNYKNTNEKIANAALGKIKNHLWYLSEEMVALAFFDEGTSFDTKTKMQQALTKSSEAEPPKKTSIEIDSIDEKQMEDFVTENTKSFFQTLGLCSSFLSKPVEDWPQEESFWVSFEAVKHMKVVNDIAERGVKLIEEYNKLITKDEQQKQYLLRVVSEYRKKLPNKAKKTIISLTKQ